LNHEHSIFKIIRLFNPSDKKRHSSRRYSLSPKVRPLFSVLAPHRVAVDRLLSHKFDIFSSLIFDHHSFAIMVSSSNYFSCLPNDVALPGKVETMGTGEGVKLNCVINILGQAEDLLTSSMDDLFEPIPIGPNATLWNNSMDEASPFKRPNDSLFQQVFQEPVFSASDCHAVLPSAPKQKRRRLDYYSAPLESNDCMPLFSQHVLSSSPIAVEDSKSSSKFRRYQDDQWNERFQELLDFKQATGHCLVHHEFEPSQKLAQWVKRQRDQFKLKQSGKHSTLTDSRQMELEDSGFVWDSHQVAWDERFESLKTFLMLAGHCSVPSHYADRKLAIWIKCQRRQWKLLLKGRKSTLNDSRVARLNSIGFVWNPRNL
jgi:hypothetical protein